MTGTQPPPFREHIPNHMVWAILTTLFCCLPFGIVSIIHAARVDSLNAAGDIAGARASSDKARFWAIVSAVSLLAIVPLYIVLLILAAASGSH